MRRLRRRFKLTIVYKSGAIVHARAAQFSLERTASGMTTMSWKRMSPVPLMIGVDDIAAVYEGHV